MASGDDEHVGRVALRPALRRQPTARQQALFNALEELFLAKGFVDFTLDDLAAELSCSKSTLYALAPSKEQLAVRVVRRFFKGAAHTIEQHVATLTDARERIDAYLAGVSAELHRASSQFMRDIASFKPARDEYERNSRAASERIQQFIAEGVDQGVFREVHAGLVAELVGVLIEGIQTGVVGERTGVTDAEAFSALADLLLGGLARGRS